MTVQAWLGRLGCLTTLPPGAERMEGNRCASGIVQIRQRSRVYDVEVLTASGGHAARLIGSS